MKLTYNGTTYELTNAQLQGLRSAAMLPSGAFVMDRRNEKTEDKLNSMGLLEMDFTYRESEERNRMRNSAMTALSDAAKLVIAGNLKGAEELAYRANQELRSLNRTRHYLTETGYAIVLRAFPMGVAHIPARFAHLLPEAVAEVK